MRLIFVAAIVKIAAGIAVAPWAATAAPLRMALPAWYYIALLLIFGGSGGLLYLGGKNDGRARLLGVVFILFGTLFTDRLVASVLPSLGGSLGRTASFLASLQLIAFEPLLVWRFAWSFPRVQSGMVPVWVPSLVGRVALLAGSLLAFGTVFAQLAWTPRFETLGLWLSPVADEGVFWQVVSILILPSLALLVAKLRAATADERRRIEWVVGGIVVGSLPMVAHVMLVTIVPGYEELSSDPVRRRTFALILTASSLVIPATTAYGVLVDRTLEVRFIIRRAVQYALARYSVIGLIAALAVALASMLYGTRNKPLTEVLGDSPARTAVLLLIAAALIWRRALLETIDRHFFREQYDARRILVELVDRSHKAHSARDVMQLITGEIDRALHVERISVLVRDDETDEWRHPDGGVRSLDANGPLGVLIAGSPTPLDVDLSSDSSPLNRLSEVEREWLADAGVRLIVPLPGSDGPPLGVLLLGDKRSELPFTKEDGRLLAAVAASAAHSLEQRLRSESPGSGPPRSNRAQPACQCVVCGRVQERPQTSCRVCDGAVHDALLPVVLAGKFEVDRQIGAGGMGVVYRARDLALNRLVAIKVLPRVIPQTAARLRREARALAIMQHPNLAVIHAMETWRGAPVLVLEYLSGGTVADRLRRGPLPIDDVVAIGTIIADVLHHIHRAGYLHRDVKPSNIGYTGEGVPKLLDFGLARLVSPSDGSTTTAVSTAAASAAGSSRPWSEADRPFDTGSHHIVGTPAYMPPEALTSASLSQDVDLWGLAVTLYESLSGRNPFSASTVAETISLIARSPVPDVRELRPDCPPELATFLTIALASDPRRRPQSADQFASGLRAAGIH